MRKIVRILRMGALRLALLAGMFLSSSQGQGTVHIDFGQLPPGTVLESQFSDLGIHFGTNWGTEATFNTVVGQSALPNQISGGPFLEVAQSVLPMTFDRLVGSISAEVAMIPRSGQQYPIRLQYVYNGPGVGGPAGGGFSDFQGNAWRNVTFASPKPANEIAFASPEGIYYVKSMDISIVPEPASLMLIAFTGFVFALARLKKTRA